MASSILRSTRFIATSRLSFAPVATRSLHATRRLAVVKESDLHNENRAADVEHHKQDQLNAKKQGEDKWKDALASDSESIVKADRGEFEHSKGDIKTLQKETAKAAEKEQK